jgi:hypothetical protein
MPGDRLTKIYVMPGDREGTPLPRWPIIIEKYFILHTLKKHTLKNLFQNHGSQFFGQDITHF